ncbi:MAG TPA: hypothetical protein VFM77_05435, partial [Terriglobales bacterium]|nr:hypothetical protein [Terriglobales bacterium]
MPANKPKDVKWAAADEVANPERPPLQAAAEISFSARAGCPGFVKVPTGKRIEYMTSEGVLPADQKSVLGKNVTARTANRYSPISGICTVARGIAEMSFPYTAGLALLALASMSPALAAEADALAISRNIQERHFPHFSLLDPIFDGPASDQIVNYTRCGDSAIWTGHYLAAEAFRYAVTRSPEALANATRAFAGIQSLVDVTGNNVLARCLVPDDSPYAEGIQNEEAHNGIYHSGPGNFWVGNTSRDQYSGVMFGLGVAYDLIDDEALKAGITGLVTRMVQFLKDHGWTVVLPDGTITTTFINRPDQQLAFLQLARHVNSDQFSTSYDISRVLLSPGVIAPILLEVLSDDSYFKFNLDTINLYTLIHLESSSFGEIYRKAYDILRNHTDDHGNAVFNMIDRAVNGPNLARDAETRLLLDQWLQRPRRDIFVDNHGKYP